MIRLSQIAAVVEGALVGPDAECHAVKIDSRSVQCGDLFVAIPGEKYDGHDYVATVSEQFAAGAMVSKPQNTEIGQVVVKDTTRSLGLLGAHWRSRFDVPVVSVTGSNGKTTVTALISTILNVTGNCLSPKGSFNNQWGVPLTLLELRDAHDYIVVEMGMNHIGELDYLSSLARPDVALLNNAAPAHLEGLGSVEKIAEAKAEIFNGLRDGGVAILNADDAFYGYWKDGLSAHEGNHSVLTFGWSENADVVIENLVCLESGSSFELKISGQRISVDIPLLGAHNAMNAAAAACAAYAIGLTPEQIKEGLENGKAKAGRLNMKNGLFGSMIVDDSYNANPASMKAGIDVLARMDRRKILVLGEMAELGDSAWDLHYQIGKYAKDAGIEQLYCLSEKNTQVSSAYVEGYGGDAKQFSSLTALVEELKSVLDADVLVVIKGSRSSGMERVVGEVTDVKSNSGELLC
ncbi:MAG: UDP-N-acetylmuramoyl-tripeptide--D-alanyl-D-alanine ligase [Gammaproteobacteria bacterium]|nr:UDP-N-acetylmuramoyl-tripeptide--D-alanyl-D-alanine ligase [Gammaproteobacteria bacterium]